MSKSSHCSVFLRWEILYSNYTIYVEEMSVLILLSYVCIYAHTYIYLHMYACMMGVYAYISIKRQSKGEMNMISRSWQLNIECLSSAMGIGINVVSAHGKPKDFIFIHFPIYVYSHLPLFLYLFFQQQQHTHMHKCEYSCVNTFR